MDTIMHLLNQQNQLRQRNAAFALLGMAAQSGAYRTPYYSGPGPNLLVSFMQAYQSLFNGFANFAGGAAQPQQPVDIYPVRPDYGRPAEPVQSTPPSLDQDASGAARMLTESFDGVDLDKDGVLTEKEILGFRQSRPELAPEQSEALDGLASAVPELMFGTIQSGRSAWFGLSREDLAAAQGRLDGGESLADIRGSLRSQVMTERNVAYNPALQTREEAFRLYVEARRGVL